MKRLLYIWLDGNNNFRSKARWMELENPDDVHTVPWWQYDGSSTGQTSHDSLNSEVFLKPVRVYNSLSKYAYKSHTCITEYIILCETYLPDKQTPHPDNKRFAAQLTFNDIAATADPWYGFEMEFFVIDHKTGLPLGFKNDRPPEQGQFYCGVGAANCYGRNMMDEFEVRCITSEIGLVGSNAEVACGQWEYQIFSKGLKAADDAWVSRFILESVAESHGYSISWHPKPFTGCNGSGMHVNFSTAAMRDPVNGREAIREAITKLSKRHKEHIDVYGAHNELRLTGKHETSSMSEFSYGVGTRNTSIRINHETEAYGYGYIEDRRPASSCDMYDVARIMAETIILL